MVFIMKKANHYDGLKTTLTKFLFCMVASTVAVTMFIGANVYPNIDVSTSTTTSFVTSSSQRIKRKERRQCAKNHGYIIANMNGRLGNNLFQIAMANRLSEELCWDIIFKEGWQGVFPNDDRAKKCFPNALQYRRDPTKFTNVDMEIYEKLKIDEYTDHFWSIQEPEKFYHMIKFRETKDLYDKWRKQSESDGTSLRIASRWEFDYHPKWEERLIASLRNPQNKSLDDTRAIHLDGYFIHYDWMRNWMDRIREWNRIDYDGCCHHVPASNVVVVHVRNFKPSEKLNPGYDTKVYTDLLDKMYFKDQTTIHKLWIVCQPDDIAIDIVKDLKKRYNGSVITGNDPCDAFCTLMHAKKLVLSTHSTFSQMAALLTVHEGKAEIHYLLPTTEHPDVTLAVPRWKYHLVDQTKDSIHTYNLPASSIKPIMS